MLSTFYPFYVLIRFFERLLDMISPVFYLRLCNYRMFLVEHDTQTFASGGASISPSFLRFWMPRTRRHSRR
jgi:hypothetical protein